MENSIITKLVEFNNQNQSILRGVLTAQKDIDDQYAVIMLGGFERSGTTEKKFKVFADKLAKNNIASFRFDATDCGLSDGNFYNMTTESLAEDLLSSIDCLKNYGYQKFSVVGHSLAGCAISLLIGKINFEKIILIAPALNQKELLRLWFTQKNNKNIKINWNNYKEYFKEDNFLENLKLDLTTKSHKLSSKYGFGNRDKDYGSNFNNISNNSILLIHGNNDDKAPLESLNIEFSNKIIIDKGDHDLEQPEIIEQWLNQAVNFLKIK